MKKHWNAIIGRAALTLALALAAERAHGGALPTLEDKPWMGYFVGYDQRNYQFTVNSDGKMELTPKDEKGKAVGFSKAFKMQVVVEETLPDGKVVGREIDTTSLTTTDKATDKPEKLKFSGKTTVGGAGFEVNLAFDGKLVRVGGRVTDPGKSKNPLRLMVRTSLSEPYKGTDSSDKNFARRIKKDEVRVERIGGKGEKFDVDKSLDVNTPEVNGKDGLSSVRFEMDAYKGRRFEFTAEQGSSLVLWNKQAQALMDGFSIQWRHDPAQDATGKTGFTIEVR